MTLLIKVLTILEIGVAVVLIIVGVAFIAQEVQICKMRRRMRKVRIRL
jgi:hypothetical protein